MSDKQKRLNYVLDQVTREYTTHNPVFIMSIVETTLQASDDHERAEDEAFLLRLRAASQGEPLYAPAVLEAIHRHADPEYPFPTSNLTSIIGPQ